MDAIETKAWWESTTIWGALVSALSLVLGFFGVHVDEATQKLVISQIGASITAISGIVGIAMTIYGRFKATKQVALSKPAA